MANLKSSKKDIKRIKIRTVRNRARLSEIKSLCKKLMVEVEAKNSEQAATLFKLAQAKIARAKGKGLFKANTASRKISVLARQIGKLTSPVA